MSSLSLRTSNASNCKPHSRWGKVYKLVIEQDTTGTRTENIQEEKGTGRKSEKEKDTDRKRKHEEKERLKEKANKDEERRNAKQEAADKRATEAEVRKTKERAVRNANRAIAKLTPLQLSLSTSLSSKYIKHVAEFATNMAKESHVAVQMVLAAAKKMVQARSGPVEFKYEADELSQVRVHRSILHTTPHPRTSNLFIPPVWPHHTSPPDFQLFYTPSVVYVYSCGPTGGNGCCEL